MWGNIARYWNKNKQGKRMKKIVFIFCLLVCGAFAEIRIYPNGDSTLKNGNIYFHDNGETNYRNGNTLFLDNGERIEKRGDSYYNSNGESTFKRGDVYYHDNGGMSWDFGGNMIHSDEESKERMRDIRDFEW